MLVSGDCVAAAFAYQSAAFLFSCLACCGCVPAMWCTCVHVPVMAGCWSVSVLLMLGLADCSVVVLAGNFGFSSYFRGDPVPTPLCLSTGSEGACVVDMHPNRLRLHTIVAGLGRVVDCASAVPGSEGSHLCFVRHIAVELGQQMTFTEGPGVCV